MVVASTGNRGEYTAYPAKYSTVLAVGCVDQNKRVESFSNAGLEVDIVALSGIRTTNLKGRISVRDGTSVASPQVTATVALILGRNPDLKPAQIRDIITQTAEDIEELGWDSASGYGLLRIDNALMRCNQAFIYKK